MPPAARVTDMHVCPMVTGVVPHVGGPIMPPGVPTVLIDFLPAATVTNMLTCVGPPDIIVKGSAGVFINFLPAARLGDQTAHGGVIVVGSPTCIIGEIGSPSPGAAGLSGIVSGLSTALSFVRSLFGLGAVKGSQKLANIVAGVNPENGTENCGNIVDAVISRLDGSDPKATASTARDGSFQEIEQKHGTNIAWGKSFQEAFDAVKAGGDKTTAIIGIVYSGGDESHVLVMTNDSGTVGILEAQNPKEVITDAATADRLYNGDGGSNVGFGLLPKK